MTTPSTSKRSQPQSAAVFRTPAPCNVPSPPLQKSKVYCLPSFTARAEQWYKQEVIRQTGAQVLEGLIRTSSRRRQPSRAAKDKIVAEEPYTLSSEEVDRIDSHGTGDMAPPPPPPGGRKESNNSDFHPHVLCFRSRLNEAVHTKAQELKARYEPAGFQHICTIADSTRNCLGEEYCGHGLVERCMRWVPKRVDEFKPRVRAEMDAFLARWVFALDEAENSSSSSSSIMRSDRLKELKRSRYAKLKEVTLGKVRVIEEEWKERPRAMVDAVMLETPTLGRWPAREFVREDVRVQTVAFAGLLFAVDVCQEEPRLMML